MIWRDLTSVLTAIPSPNKKKITFIPLSFVRDKTFGRLQTGDIYGKN